MATFAVTSLIAYLFRMRQLYATVPKLFKYSPVSTGGSLCEVIVLNRGNHPEESVVVVLDPSLRCELVASSEADVVLADSTIKFERLHKGKELSAILLVENGILDHTKIVAVSSKQTSGKVFKRPADVPPNAAMTALFFAFFLGVFPAMYYGAKGAAIVNRYWVEHRLATVYKDGWSGLEKRYADSDIRRSYSNQEFPVRLVSYVEDRKKSEGVARYEGVNKTAAVVDMTVRPEGMEIAPSLHYFTSIKLLPMSKNEFEIRGPLSAVATDPLKFEFSFSTGRDYVNGVFHNPMGQVRTNPSTLRSQASSP